MRSRTTCSCRPTRWTSTAAAGARTPSEGEEPAVAAAIRADPKLTARERQALLEIYDAFVERRRPRRGNAPP